MPTIKLDAIRQEALIPIRFKLPEGKLAELNEYLAFFNETHGSDVELQALLPHLIGAFLAEDRAFIRWRADRHAVAPAPTPSRPQKHGPPLRPVGETVERRD